MPRKPKQNPMLEQLALLQGLKEMSQGDNDMLRQIAGLDAIQREQELHPLLKQKMEQEYDMRQQLMPYEIQKAQSYDEQRRLENDLNMRRILIEEAQNKRAQEGSMFDILNTYENYKAQELENELKRKYGDRMAEAEIGRMEAQDVDPAAWLNGPSMTQPGQQAPAPGQADLMTDLQRLGIQPGVVPQQPVGKPVLPPESLQGKYDDLGYYLPTPNLRTFRGQNVNPNMITDLLYNLTGTKPLADSANNYLRNNNKSVLDAILEAFNR